MRAKFINESLGDILKPKSKDDIINDLSIFTQQELNNKLLDYINGRRRITNIKLLLDVGADANAKDEHGNSCLMIACLKGRLDIIELLLKAGADINYENNYGNTVIDFAKSNINSYFIAKKILNKYGAQINESLGNILKPKITDEIVKDLSNLTQEELNDKLLYDVSGRLLNNIKLLLDAGADVNATDEFGNSCLMRAVTTERLDIIELLLKAGANINHKNNYDNSVLDYAKSNTITYFNIKKLLNKYGAQINESLGNILKPKSKDDIINDLSNLNQKELNDELIYAAHVNRVGIIQLLIDAGVNVNAQNTFGSTSLKLAAENGYLNIVKILLNNNANINLTDKWGDTALSSAIFNGYEDIVNLLKKYGAKE